MPYKSLDDLPENIQKLPEKDQRQWRAVWNSAYNKAKKDGKNDEEAEQAAFAQANGVLEKAASEILERLYADMPELLTRAGAPAEAAEPNAEYLAKLKDLILSKTKDGDLSDADVRAIMKAAAGYSGGKTKARNRQEAGEIRIAAEVDGSLWVGYWLPEDVAAQIAIPGGIDPSELHLTLCYLGSGTDLPMDAAERVTDTVRAFSYKRQAFPVCINGAARFKGSGNSQGQDVIYAVVSGDSIHTLREELCFELASAGIVNPWGDFYGYTPHVTLAYVESGADMAAFMLPNVELMLDSLTVTTGKTPEDRQTFPMRGPRYSAYGPIMMSEFMEPPKTIPVLPRPGSYSHPVYGEIVMDDARLEHFMTQFEAGVYQNPIPIDLEHETKLSGAAGWITSLVQNEDGSVDGVVDWTDRGKEALERDRFAYISPEWYEEWIDPITETMHSDILIGAALTTRPFFKAAALRPLAASESPSSVGGSTMTGTPVEKKPEAQSPPAASAESITAAEQSRRLAELEESNRKLTADLEANKAAREASETQSKQLAETVKRMANDQRRQRFTDEVTGRSESNNVRYHGDPAGHVMLMEHLADTADGGEDSEVFKNYVTNNRALGAQLKTTLMREVGSSAGGDTGASAQERITKMASARASEKGIGIAEAQRQVMAEHPDLAYQAGVEAQVRV